MLDALGFLLGPYLFAQRVQDRLDRIGLRSPDRSSKGRTTRMPQKPETRIVTRTGSDGKVEVSAVDVHSGRQISTGLKVPPEKVPGYIGHLKTTLEKAGNRASVHEG